MPTFSGGKGSRYESVGCATEIQFCCFKHSLTCLWFEVVFIYKASLTLLLRQVCLHSSLTKMPEFLNPAADRGSL